MSFHGNVIALTLCLLALALPSFAQQTPCAARAELAEHLQSQFKEIQTGAGLQSRSRLVEIWASTEGSWTIVATDAQGISCIVASGTHWQDVDPPVELSGIAG